MFGIRTIKARSGPILLNGEPIFLVREKTVGRGA